MNNIFEHATRNKMRFPSSKGELNIEQLWDLPLIAKGRQGSVPAADLDTVARTINTELKGMTEESFVSVTPDKRRDALAAKLDVVKHIIAVKQAEEEADKQAAERKLKRMRLTQALAAKQEEKLGSMSEDEIRKALAELEA